MCRERDEQTLYSYITFLIYCEIFSCLPFYYNFNHVIKYGYKKIGISIFHSLNYHILGLFSFLTFVCGCVSACLGIFEFDPYYNMSSD